jgi:hypothetical protein
MFAMLDEVVRREGRFHGIGAIPGDGRARRTDLCRGNENNEAAPI